MGEIMALPPELWQKIFANLDVKSLRNGATLTCKSWRNLIRSDPIFSGHVILQSKITREQFISVLEGWPALRSLKLESADSDSTADRFWPMKADLENHDKLERLILQEPMTIETHKSCQFKALFEVEEYFLKAKEMTRSCLSRENKFYPLHVNLGMWEFLGSYEEDLLDKRFRLQVREPEFDDLFSEMKTLEVLLPGSHKMEEFERIKSIYSKTLKWAPKLTSLCIHTDCFDRDYFEDEEAHLEKQASIKMDALAEAIKTCPLIEDIELAFTCGHGINPIDHQILPFFKKANFRRLRSLTLLFATINESHMNNILENVTHLKLQEIVFTKGEDLLPFLKNFPALKNLSVLQTTEHLEPRHLKALLKGIEFFKNLRFFHWSYMDHPPHDMDPNDNELSSKAWTSFLIKKSTKKLMSNFHPECYATIHIHCEENLGLEKPNGTLDPVFWKRT